MSWVTSALLFRDSLNKGPWASTPFLASSIDDPPMPLQVRNLTKDYATRSGPLSVLRGIDLDLAPGQTLAVMGPSGSGKSTMLYILGTLDEPTSGTVRLEDKDPFGLPERDLAAFRNRTLGF